VVSRSKAGSTMGWCDGVGDGAMGALPAALRPKAETTWRRGRWQRHRGRWRRWHDVKGGGGIEGGKLR
jgi:hypothetical protein